MANTKTQLKQVTANRRRNLKPKSVSKTKSILHLKRKAKLKSSTKSKHERTWMDGSNVDSDWSIESSEKDDTTVTKATARVRNRLQIVTSGLQSSPQKNAPEAAEDPFAILDTATPHNDVGTLCELHAYDSRFDSKGDLITLRTGTQRDIKLEEERSPKAALILTRHFDYNKILSSTRLEIKSPYIKSALQHVVKSYPGIDISSGANPTLFGKPKCLFHFRHELEEYAMESEDLQAKKHVLFCLQYMRKYIREDIAAYESMMNGSLTQPGLDFDKLWMAFKPGTLLYKKKNDVELILRLKDMSLLNENDIEDGLPERWALEVEGIQTDGKVFGCVGSEEWIFKYDGYKALADLAIYPLQYHKDQERIRKELADRGNKYVSLFDIHYRMYEGTAEFIAPNSPYPLAAYMLRRDKIATLRVKVCSRVIVDPSEFFATHGNHSFEFVTGSTIRTESSGHIRLSQDELMMCHNKVPGFCFATKRWGYFFVKSIHEISFNAKAFENLVFPQDKKIMISSLVQTSEESQVTFDDFIQGKGRGIIFLLHGPPGVGKTSTAESIAEHTHRPLYSVSCGDLGIIGEAVEHNLSKALALATRWDAVALIDEADVFMEARTVNDYGRNALVSVLLRCLEYYEGILFLTTNRVGVIDPAFKSRIHFSIAYPQLSVESRCELWKTFIIQQAFHQERPEWLDEKLLGEISQFDINGRQIKNAVRVAHALATNQKRTMVPDDIKSVLHALKSFDADFKGTAKGWPKPLAWGFQLVQNLFIQARSVFKLVTRYT